MLSRPNEGIGLAFYLFCIYFLFPSYFFLLAFPDTLFCVCVWFFFFHVFGSFFAYIYKDRLNSLLSQELEFLVFCFNIMLSYV